MKIIIDRFEGDFAIVELPDKSIQKLPLIFIPHAKEGDIVILEIDMEASKSRKDTIESRATKLWGK